jgi:biopolymer transport protein ExbD
VVAVNRSAETSWFRRPEHFETFVTDDYDNAANNNNNRQLSLRTFSRSSAGSGGGTSGSGTRSNCDEQSLDHLVAHLLGELTPAETSIRAEENQGQHKTAELQSSRSISPLIRAPADDMDDTSHDYDVPRASAMECGTDDEVFRLEKFNLERQQHLAVLKIDKPGSFPSLLVDAAAAGVMSDDNADYDIPRSPIAVSEVQLLPPTITEETGTEAGGSGEKPPMLVIHKKESLEGPVCGAIAAVQTAASAVCDQEVQITEKCIYTDQVVTRQQAVTVLGQEQNDPVYSVPHCYNITDEVVTAELSNDNVEISPTKGIATQAQQPVAMKISSSESQSSEMFTSPSASMEPVTTPQGSCDFSVLKTPDSHSLKSSRDSREMQQPLFDQFKVLRLDVLTSTSQLLSCVGGTWKRGDKLLEQSKLTSGIKPLCMALRTSLTRFENFVQLLTTKSAEIEKWQLYDSMILQIRTLQEIQRGLDTYTNSLADSNDQGNDGDRKDHSKRDGNLGTIVHLTKEIPKLVRTFVPLIELMTQYEGQLLSCAVAQPGESAVVVEPILNSVALPESNSLQLTIELPKTVNTSVSKWLDNVTHENNETNQANIKKSEDIFEKPVDVEKYNTNVSDASAFDHEEISQNGEQSLKHDSQMTVTILLPTVTRTAVADANDLPPPTPPPKQRVASKQTSLGLCNGFDSSLKQQSPISSNEHVRACSEMTDVEVSCPLVKTKADDLNGNKLSVTDVPHHTSVTLDDIAEETSSQPIAFTTISQTDNHANTISGHMAEAYYQPVVMRRPSTAAAGSTDGGDPGNDSAGCCRISRSELETPDIRASGISQTMVDQLEELQREANAQNVHVHTDGSADYDNFDVADADAFMHQSQLCEDDRRLLVFYCHQMTSNWNVLDNAASAFFACMDRRQPPKVFVMHSKFVILAGHKMAYIGDVLAKNIVEENARDWIVAYSNRLCNSLKMAVRTTKEAALGFPAIPAQQQMVDSIKDVTDWAIELKEVVDRLTYLGRPDHVLA